MTHTRQPDLILYNGNIYTMDSTCSKESAVAVSHGRITAIGNDDLKNLTGPATEVIDLKGAAVIPGIVDSHIHLLELGAKLSFIRLDECQSSEEMMELVRQTAKETPPGQWIIGQGWNEARFTDPRLPCRHDIDPATDTHPVILMRFFNMDVVNTVALKLAGITTFTPDPQGGKIEHSRDGTPSGILRASAKQLVRSLIPKPGLEEIKTILSLACPEIHRFGITSVVEPGLRPFEINAYQSFYQEGKLGVRINMMPSWHGFLDEENEQDLDHRARALGIGSGFGDSWLRIGALKMALDGGTTSRTAFMYDPFEGEKSVVNYNRLNENQIHRYLSTAQELGWDVGVHCCGDRAQDMVVDAMSQVVGNHPRKGARHSIIHGYFPSDQSIDQMAEHEIAAVIQPTFIYWEGDTLFKDVGKVRADNYKPARKYIDHGVRVISGSDMIYTVSANPFIALYALVTRKNLFGQLVAPSQAVTREEALRTYTLEGAWLTREQKIKGSLEPGKVADMAVLDRDYFTIPEEEIKEIQVKMTLAGGRVVYASDKIAE